MDHLFGYLDATSDTEQRQFLDRSFVLTQAIEEAMKPDIAFVSGRRGTGKSAVLHRLVHAKTSEYRASVILRASDYEQLHLQLVTNLLTHPHTNEITPQGLRDYFHRIWRYVLELCALQCCLQIEPARKDEEEAYHVVEEFIKQNGGRGVTPSEQAMTRFQHILTTCISGDTAILSIANQLNALNRDPQLQRALVAAKVILKQCRSIILIDSLEKYNVEPRRVAPFQGLCEAVKWFHDRRFFENGVDVKCFLPAEVTPQVFKQNLAKYGSLTTTLRWRYAELIEFVARRYATFLRNQPDPDLVAAGDAIVEKANTMVQKRVTGNRNWRDSVWSLFMEPTVSNRFDWLEDTAAYWFRHTQLRPRECLIILNHVGSDLRRNRLSLVRVTGETIRRVTQHPENLRILLQDTLAIYEDRYPEVSVSDLVQTIMTGERIVLKEAELRRKIGRGMSLIAADGRGQREELLRLLLESGLIGVVRKVARPVANDKRMLYYCTSFEYCGLGHLVINDTSLCAAHPVISAALGLEESEEGPGVVYHLSESADEELVDGVAP